MSMTQKKFDPNGPGQILQGLFGLPFSPEESDIVILPVPWDVTTSYRPGTANGPAAILTASPQLDLYHPDFPDMWKKGVALLPIPEEIQKKSEANRRKAETIIKLWETGQNPVDHPDLVQINGACADLNDWVYQQAKYWLERGKKVGLLGGDHSTPLGFIKALHETHGEFGILQIDAHLDLREAYEGFIYSHASIMYNARAHVKSLTQVGIRDACDAEVQLAKEVFWDRDIKQRLYRGETFKSIVDEIVKKLPKQVYISFDIDGLNPALCPNTGTPVPGGLEFEHAMFLVGEVVRSGRTIVGFDLVEVAADEWDANVGARVLFHLCGYTSLMKTRG